MSATAADHVSVMSPGAGLHTAIVEHAMRGVRLQIGLRGALVVFVVATIVLVPPVQAKAACYAIASLYAVFAVGFALWARRGGPVVASWAWLGLFVDVAALAAVTLVSGIDAEQSWTDDVLLHGLFVVPVLAATQLRPGVCAAVAVPTVAVFLASSSLTRIANEEPWESVALRTLALAVVSVGCVGLSRIQRSRVETIGRLVGDRTRLLDDLVHLEDRERRELSEQLHDGALQYVLAARQDLDDLAPGGTDGAGRAEAIARIEHALGESSRLLRAKVTELHPAVLEHAGLAKALRDLAAAQQRDDRVVHVDLDGWPDGRRTDVDVLLFGAARELLGNAAKHAAATSVRLTLDVRDGSARLVVADDGRGISATAVGRALDQGHVGLHTQRLRIEAAGGTLTVEPGEPNGTVATVELPLPALGAG